MYDVYEIRKDFPVLNEMINDKPFFYLDTSASAQKPQQVLDKMMKVYQTTYANPHRGSYTISEEMTTEYEQARETVREFINAKRAPEIIYTRNATKSINLVASSWGGESKSRR